jgi:uncharacterized membrane protein
MSKKSYEKANFTTPKGDDGSTQWLDWLEMAGKVLAFMLVVGVAWRILPELWSVIDAALSGR